MNKSESKYFNTAVKMDEALLALLEKKDFAYITVKELCETAGVNRSTFYLHYETVDDLLAECVEYMNNKCFQRYSEHIPRSSGEVASAKLEDLVFITPEYLKIYLEFVRENKHLIQVALNHPTTLRTDNTLEKLSASVLSPVLGRFNFAEDEKDYVLSFYIKGFMGIVAQWLEEDCAASVERIIHICTQCILPCGLDAHLKPFGGAGEAETT